MLSVLTGCEKYIFYEPAAQSGKIVGLFCRGGHPPGRIEFVQKGFEISMGIVRQQLKFTMLVPKDRKVSFALKEVEFVSTDRQQYLLPHKVQGVPFHYPPEEKPTILPPVSPMVLDGNAHDVYEMYLTLPAGRIDRFVIRMPPFFLNEEGIRFPPITFTLKSGWYPFVLNC
jgi:hypothetical protein